MIALPTYSNVELGPGRVERLEHSGGSVRTPPPQRQAAQNEILVTSDLPAHGSTRVIVAD